MAQGDLGRRPQAGVIGCAFVAKRASTRATTNSPIKWSGSEGHNISRLGAPAAAIASARLQRRDPGALYLRGQGHFSAVGPPEAVKPAALPPGTHAGINDWGRAGYGGPCPPVGRHRYLHKLHALDIVLPKLAHPDKQALEAAMQGHILAAATLVGTCQKHR
jgi:hypothetical protein